MLDFSSRQNRIVFIDREDRALLRSNPSARSMPEDGQEHVLHCMLLLPRSSFGRKAINLPNWCEAPTSSLSILYLWVEALQLYSRIGGGELPINTFLQFIPFHIPRMTFRLQPLNAFNSPIKTLSA
jgi:hypothetical protein